MKVTIEGKELCIRIPMTEPTLSASGKNYSVASTRGNFKTDQMVNGKPIVIGLNAYISAK